MTKMKRFLNNFEIEIIIKHNIDGYSFKELSIEYNKPLNTIISIYHRGLKKFKDVNKMIKSKSKKTNDFI